MSSRWVENSCGKNIHVGKQHFCTTSVWCAWRRDFTSSRKYVSVEIPCVQVILTKLVSIQAHQGVTRGMMSVLTSQLWRNLSNKFLRCFTSLGSTWDYPELIFTSCQWNTCFRVYCLKYANCGRCFFSGHYYQGSTFTLECILNFWEVKSPSPNSST